MGRPRWTPRVRGRVSEATGYAGGQTPPMPKPPWGDPRAVGTEPDYRFTLANERTFLAWIRTSLALAAGGLGAINLIDDFYGQEWIGLILLGLSFLTAATAYRRWVTNERSMRLGVPLPTSHLPALIAVGTALLGIGAAVLFVVGES